MVRKSPIRKVSSKQAKKNRTWSALKLARIKDHLEGLGFVSCSRCPKRFYSIGAAQMGLDAHHVVQKSLGGPYSDLNMELLCCGPGSCHEKAHSSEGLRSARLSSSL